MMGNEIVRRLEIKDEKDIKEFLRKVRLQRELNYRMLNSSHVKCAMAVFSKSGIKKLAYLKHLNWDSNFFNKKMGRLFYYRNDTGIETGHKLIESLVKKAHHLNYEHIMCRIKANDFPTLWTLECANFNIVDTALTLTFDFGNGSFNGISSKHNINQCKKEDVKDLQKIASYAFRSSYFYVDSLFKQKEVDEMHKVWVLNLFNDHANKILVAKDNKKIVGFVTCSIDKIKNVGVIDLIGVDKKYLCRGIASALINKALVWFSTKVKQVVARTQLKNYPAIALYQKARFKVTNSDCTFCLTIHS